MCLRAASGAGSFEHQYPQTTATLMRVVTVGLMRSAMQTMRSLHRYDRAAALPARERFGRPIGAVAVGGRLLPGLQGFDLPGS